MQMSICLCRHGLPMLHEHPTTVDGSSNSCTDTLVMSGNTISIARTLSSSLLCRACTRKMAITGSTGVDEGISIDPSYQKLTTPYVMAHSGDRILVLALCLI